jgi:hypothetical protein
MMEAVNASETSVNFYQATWRSKPEQDDVHSRRENLKSRLLPHWPDEKQTFLFSPELFVDFVSGVKV